MSWLSIIIFALIMLFGLTAFTGAPYVPSRHDELRIAFRELYKLSKNDLLVDLGSGDGSVLKIANEFGAKSFGIEINPLLVLVSRFRLRRHKNAKVKLGNLFTTPLPKETTLIYTFGESRDINKMLSVARNHAKTNHKTVYFMSYGFPIKSLKPFKKNRALYLYKIS